MRADGDVTYFVIQHQWNSEGRWVDSGDGASFLFDTLTFDQQCGVLGNYYRSLVAPHGANSNLWQRFGIDGFEYKDDALSVLRELRALPRCPHKFRLVRRRMTRTQEVVA